MGMFGKFKHWLAGSDDVDAPMEAMHNNPANPAFEHLSDYLNYGAYDPKTELFLLKTGSDNKPLGMGFTIELNPFLGADDDLVGKLGNLYALLPEKTPIQVQIFGSPDLRGFLKAYETIQSSRAEDDPMQPVFQTLAQKRTEYWRKGTQELLVKNSTVRLRTLRCILSINLDISPDNPTEVSRAVSLLGRMRDSLRSLQIYDRTWTPVDLKEWCSLMLNPNRMFIDLTKELDPVWDETRFLNEQMVETRTSLKVMDSGSGLRFGHRDNEDCVIARCYSVNLYPEEFHLAGMGALIGDAVDSNMSYTSPFLISMTMFKEEYDVAQNTITLKAARATQTADSKMAAVMPQAIKQKRDYGVCLSAFGKGGGGTVKLMHQVVLWERPQNINLAESQAESIWKSEGFGLYRDQYLQLGSYLTALPMATDKEVVKYLNSKKRWHTKTMTNAICMSPIIGEWHGLGEPVIGLFGRRGQAMGIDLFANPAGNYNFAIIGASGSGKSFFANEIVRNYMGLGTQIWIIDVGRSYEKFCQMIGGQYIEFTYEAKLCFPPFQMVTEIHEDIELLKLIFCLMASPSDSLTEQQEAKLQRIIEEVWYEHRQEGTVDHVMERCLNCLITGTDENGVPGERDLAMVAVADQLYAYSSQGIYGQYFNGTLNVEFTNDLVVLELEELKTKPDLQQIIMQMIMYRIMQAMYLSRRKYKIMMIDEAWALLGDTGSAARFIEEGYRRVRKYKGACGTLTQGANDYYKTKAAEAALENADFVFHMRTGAKSLKTIEEKEPFEVNSGVMKILRSLSKTDYYSEIFISTPIGYGVGRLYSDPFNALASSSKADDVEAVDRYRREGLNMAQAIESVLADRSKYH
ncbi:type IV secretion system protein TraC [Neisseria weixii]|uniref:Type IV secretion system protein TraC n=1 Tax=Neisseria weixii TaxID=1853276 RepID=A0A3N4MQK3_9NEIS|nr:type IV secretion system protein TraC [Neisseria weixii]RPD86124.1 type IV secretion system protein TraC [Neisseria weixii]RPD86857.1 type IV secretion system protein TraC [Neisseria weixii]